MFLEPLLDGEKTYGFFTKTAQQLVAQTILCISEYVHYLRSLYRAFSTLRPFGLLYSYPQQVPAFISRGAMHHTDARDFYQRRRELFPMNFASKSVIYENPLGSFTCRKAGTWDILFYFPSEGRHTEDFLDARKIQWLQPGLNPLTRVPVASMLITRPPKLSVLITYCILNF